MAQCPECPNTTTAREMEDGQIGTEEALSHGPTGTSVVEPDSYMDESGRSFHSYKQGESYFFPNDAAEQDRLNSQHNIFLLVSNGRLNWAPIPTSTRYVMDVATGTGIWAIQFAQQNPSSHVVGIDLSKIQPENVPSNCEFVKKDAEEDWTFSNVSSFDYVHLRAVGMSFVDPKRVLQQAWDNLGPEGWIEYQDMVPEPYSQDGCHEGTAMQKWYSVMRRALALKGRDPASPRFYKGWLQEVGCQNITEQLYDIPNGRWQEDPKWRKIGSLLSADLIDSVRGASWQLFRDLGMTTEEVEDLVKRVQDELANPRYRVLYKMHIVYEQKPLDAAS